MLNLTVRLLSRLLQLICKVVRSFDSSRAWDIAVMAANIFVV